MNQRLVFDTNILVSQLLLPQSTPAQAVRKGLAEGQILVSNATLQELATVLSRPKFDPYISVEDRQEFFRKFGRVVDTISIIRTIKICRYPRDDKFLELAVNGKASHLITGDQDLLDLHPFQGTKIITATHYLNENK